MHELVHLDFVVQAREKAANKLFVTNAEHKRKFIRTLEATIKNLKKRGVPEPSIATYCTELFEGLNRQVFNAPIDLFIEDFLYNEMHELRPYQFVSMLKIVTEGKEAVTNKKVAEISPKDVLVKSKIYNLVTALQLKDLFGVNLLPDFNATEAEKKQAQTFFDEFLEYRENKEPAEEYELVQHWAHDLKLDDYFELIEENKFRNKPTDIDELLTSIEEDPFDMKSDKEFKDQQTETFLKSQKEIGLNMAVVMFMIDALKFFEEMPESKIKHIAMEIAMIGTQGIHPDSKDYKVGLIKGKTFSGYHLLAYYYVSWKLAIPEMLSQLKLPFDKEYAMAESMFKPMK